MSHDHKPLSGKVAFVTGGARGIGAAIARKLARHGCRLIINYYNSSDLAEKLSAELTEAYGVEAITLQGSVAIPASVKEMVETIARTHERIDILVNNAASGVLKPALKMSLKHWRWCMETNAFALSEIVRQLHPMMPPGSSVISLSSAGASRAIPNYAYIGASKAALEALTRSLSIELAAADIAFNVISAGVVDTDAIKYFPNREELLAGQRERSCVGRDLTPDDIADAVYLLCLPEARLIRGQTIYVDGGFSVIG
jgi:enoyl-[acyl-carrier protein] reductase III